MNEQDKAVNNNTVEILKENLNVIRASIEKVQTRESKRRERLSRRKSAILTVREKLMQKAGEEEVLQNKAGNACRTTIQNFSLLLFEVSNDFVFNKFLIEEFKVYMNELLGFKVKNASFANYEKILIIRSKLKTDLKIDLSRNQANSKQQPIIIQEKIIDIKDIKDFFVTYLHKLKVDCATRLSALKDTVTHNEYIELMATMDKFLGFLGDSKFNEFMKVQNSDYNIFKLVQVSDYFKDSLLYDKLYASFKPTQADVTTTKQYLSDKVLAIHSVKWWDTRLQDNNKEDMTVLLYEKIYAYVCSKGLNTDKQATSDLPYDVIEEIYYHIKEKLSSSDPEEQAFRCYFWEIVFDTRTQVQNILRDYEIELKFDRDRSTRNSNAAKSLTLECDPITINSKSNLLIYNYSMRFSTEEIGVLLQQFSGAYNKLCADITGFKNSQEGKFLKARVDVLETKKAEIAATQSLSNSSQDVNNSPPPSNDDRLKKPLNSSNNRGFFGKIVGGSSIILFFGLLLFLAHRHNFVHYF